MKILFRLFAFALLLLPALAACSGSDANTETATSDPSGPVVRIYYPPT
jgi:ABC-type glycerol-3-phosphate transport system substrate-binding protein